MSGHPADEAFLNTLVFTSPTAHRYCDSCEKQAPTVFVRGIETGSGGGYDIRHCRGCVESHLARARARVRRPRDYQSALPRCG